MERRNVKTNLFRFDVRHLTQVVFLTLTALLCLTATFVYSHPVPKDSTLKITTVKQLLGGDSREESFAVMSLDVSAMELTVYDNGQVQTVYVSQGTVADALERVGITIGEFDKISIDYKEQIKSGMEIYITRVTVEEEYRYEPIPFETVLQSSSSLLKGSELIVQKGEDGTLRYTYDIIFKNGVMTDRVLSGTEVYKKPVSQVVVCGTSAVPPSSSYTVSTTSQILTLDDGTQIPYESYIDVAATAYTTEGASFNITKSGAVARYGIIAVDPKVIPLGTKMYVVSADGDWVYGYAVAGDTGGFIKGNRIDLFYDTIAECVTFGRRNARVYILG